MRQDLREKHLACLNSSAAQCPPPIKARIPLKSKCWKRVSSCETRLDREQLNEKNTCLRQPRQRSRPEYENLLNGEKHARRYVAVEVRLVARRQLIYLFMLIGVVPSTLLGY